MALHPNSGGPSGPATHRSDPDYEPVCDQCGVSDAEGFLLSNGVYLCVDCAEEALEK